MTCDNCKPDKIGNMIFTDRSGYCSECGDKVLSQTVDNSKWDIYFHSICIAVSSKSPCLSRKIGAILVRDHSIVSTGFNGPSRGIPHCGQPRLLSDIILSDYLLLSFKNQVTRKRIDSECPRKILGYESGTHMELCPAQHAEVNAISNAARLGVSVLGSTLYMNCVIPCKNCFGALINAGVIEIVVDDIKVYDKHTQYLIDNSSIKVRRFSL
jgi:dCMP deaminase